MLAALALIAAAGQAEPDWGCVDVAFGVSVGETRIARVITARAALTPEPKAAKPGARPYLVRGDTVLIGPEHRGYVAAVYPAGKGLSWGCLQAPSVQALPAPPTPQPHAWLGDWTAIHGECCSANFEIKARGNAVAIKGFATWMDPKFPMGMRDNEIDATGTIRGDRLSTADGAGECKFEMQLLGRYLIVADVASDDCIPSNASFGGIYTRS